METTSNGDKKTLGGGLEEIQSLGDVLTNRQRKRFKAGDKLLGRYRILGELGQGGMGLVFRCLDEVGGIEVAVKMLPPEVSHDSGEMEDVRENFRLVAGLAHPNIATVRTLERDEATGEYLLVMELAQGVNLRQWRKSEARGPRGEGGGKSQYPISNNHSPISNGIPLAQILPIVRQVAAALDHAHENRVVHRDVKPSNVMVDAAGHVKVLDFGLAAQIHTSFSRVSQVRYGTSGTGPYMAPEQWRGQYQDGATDQYALAILAYELIAGHCPFESHETSVLRESVLKEEPARPKGLPEPAWQALKLGLAKEREGRFASCGEFARALGGEKISPQRTQRGGGWKWATGAILLAGLAAAGWGAWKSLQKSGAEFRGQNGDAHPANGSGTTPSQEAIGQGADMAKGEPPSVPRLGLLEEAPQTTGELRATKADVIPARSAAEYAWRQVAEYDRGEGFGPLLDDAEVALNTASNFFIVDEYDKAKAGYEDVLARTQELKNRERGRRGAVEARDKANEAHTQAERAEASRWTATFWQAGETLQQEGHEAFDDGKFAQAKDQWSQAAEQYRQAAEKVLKTRLKAVLDQARLAQVKGDWAEVLNQASAALALDGANAEAQKIKQAAEAQLTSRLIIRATAGGQEVAVTVTDGKGGSWRAPTTLRLKKGGRYTFTVACDNLSGKRWNPATTNVTAIWMGTKTITVALEEIKGPVPGQDTRIEDLAMNLVWVEAGGSFQMGSEFGNSDEKPVRMVRITQGFWMGKTEVSNSQYRQFLRESGYAGALDADEVSDSNYQRYLRESGAEVTDADNGYLKHLKGGSEMSAADDYPIVRVSWKNAEAFCIWLTGRERRAGRLPPGYIFRLPTEAEWEYAARGGTRSRDYAYSGANEVESVAWYGGNSDKTQPVGQKAANELGLYDMSGNVWEWCWDYYHYYNELGEVNPKGSLLGSYRGYRVFRGGSVGSDASCCRVAFRRGFYPLIALDIIGFRVALAAPVE